MAKNDEADGLDLKGMRDDTIKTMMGMLKTASEINSKEPSSKLLKNQVKKIVATYEKDFKNDSSEKQKENLYNLIKTQLTNTNRMVDTINNGSNQPIKNIVDQASLAFQKSREFDFAGSDNHLGTIEKTINANTTKSQNKEIESTSVKKNIKTKGIKANKNRIINRDKIREILSEIKQRFTPKLRKFDSNININSITSIEKDGNEPKTPRKKNNVRGGMTK